MNKFLFSALLSTLSLSTFAQEQKISFEVSEGYNPYSEFNGQKGWSTVGFISLNNPYITGGNPSEGEYSVIVQSENFYQYKWGGIRYNLSNYQHFSISTDVSLESLNKSSHELLKLISSQGLELVNIGSFIFHSNGTVNVGSDKNSIDISNSTWQQNRWYNLKIEVNLNKKEIKFFINNSLVYITTIDSYIEKIDEVNYLLDNNNSNFYIDNVVIKNLENLSTDDLNKKEIKIYPNPVQDVLSIQTNDKINSVEIFDLTGKSILKSSDKNINTQSLSKGIYIVKIKTDNQEISQKIIKK